MMSTSQSCGSSASRKASRNLANLRTQGMIRKLQCEKPAATEFQHLRRLGKDAEDRCAVRPSDFVREASRDHARQHLVEHHDELTDLELPGDLHGYGRSLKVLSIRPKQDDKHIGDGNAEERFFVQTRVSVDEEI